MKVKEKDGVAVILVDGRRVINKVGIKRNA